MFRRLDQFDFHHILEATPGLALVLFSAAACGGCRQWKRLLEASAARRGDLQLFEVDAGLDPGLAAEFEVFHLPALFLYVDGRYQGPLEVEASPAALDRGIAALLAAPPREAP